MYRKNDPRQSLIQKPKNFKREKCEESDEDNSCLSNEQSDNDNRDQDEMLPNDVSQRKRASHHHHKINIYTEPDLTKLTKVSRMEDEIQKNYGKKPIDIFIKHAQDYSKTGLEPIVLNYLNKFHEYHPNDFKDKILPKTIFGISIPQFKYEKDAQSPNIQNVLSNSVVRMKNSPEKKPLFWGQLNKRVEETKEFKIKTWNEELPLEEKSRQVFFDFLFVEGSMYMMVKTWTKVFVSELEEEEELLQNDKDQMIKIPEQKVAHILQPENAVEKKDKASKRRNFAKNKTKTYTELPNKVFQRRNDERLNDDNKTQENKTIGKKTNGKLNVPPIKGFNDLNQSKSLQKIGVNKGGFMFLKTIKIFDTKTMYKTMLVEQVTPTKKEGLTRSGEEMQDLVEREEFYNTSTIQFQNALYFFKRVYQGTYQDSTESKLVLYKFELNTKEGGEQPRAQALDYEIDESFGDLYSCKYNTVFSQRLLGRKKQKPPRDEREFLNQQFVILQPYTMEQYGDDKQHKCLKKVKIFDMGSRSILWDNEDEDVNKAEIQYLKQEEEVEGEQPKHLLTRASMQFKVINTVHHINDYSDKKEEQNLIRFMMTDKDKVTIIRFIEQPAPAKKIDSVPRKDYIFVKIQEFKNSMGQEHEKPQIPYKVHKIDIQHDADSDQQSAHTVVQYFTINSKGQINLIFPMAQSKIQWSRVIDQIYERFKINVSKNQVVIQQFSPDNTSNKICCQDSNVFKNVLNLQEDRQNYSELQFVYGEDYDQQLLISIDPSNITLGDFLRVVRMKDHLCIKCKSDQIVLKTENIKTKAESKKFLASGLMRTQTMVENKIGAQKLGILKSPQYSMKDDDEINSIRTDEEMETQNKQKVPWIDGQEHINLTVYNSEDVEKCLGFQPQKKDQFQILLQNANVGYNYWLGIFLVTILNNNVDQRAYIFVRKSFKEMEEIKSEQEKYFKAKEMENDKLKSKVSEQIKNSQAKEKSRTPQSAQRKKQASAEMSKTQKLDQQYSYKVKKLDNSDEDSFSDISQTQDKESMYKANKRTPKNVEYPTLMKRSKVADTESKTQQAFMKLKPLIDVNDKIHLLVEKDNLIEITLSDVRSFMRNVQTEKNENNEDGEREIYSARGLSKKQIINNSWFKEIKLIFPETIFERMEKKFRNFLPMVYMEMKAPEKNSIMVYDLKDNKFRDSLCILPDQKNIPYLNQDKKGFNNYLFCQSSNIIEEAHMGHMEDVFNSDQDKVYHTQRVKFSLFALYKEELGRIRMQDFVIQQDANKNIIIQLVGIKQIIFSNEFIEQCDYKTMIEHSNAFPYKDEELSKIQGQIKVTAKQEEQQNESEKQEEQQNDQKTGKKVSSQIQQQQANVEQPKVEQYEKFVIKGSMLTIKYEKKDKNGEIESLPLNLMLKDQNLSNLFTHSSDVILFGNIKVALHQNKPEFSAHVISTQLRKDLIEERVLENQEVVYLLEKAQQKILSMRRPNLHYIVMNNFEDLKEKDFFSSQEMLNGKSICDICLNDPYAITNALEKFDTCGIVGGSNSILEALTGQDRFRRKIFEDMGYSQNTMLIGVDFNFQGTIQRAMMTSSINSLNMIIEKIFEHLNSSEYRDIIMFDLAKILRSREVSIPGFFNRFETEQKFGKIIGKDYLTIETKIFDGDLPAYSEHENEIAFVNQIPNQSSLKPQIITILKDRDHKMNTQARNSNKTENNFEIEHFFINFSIMILSEKLKNFQEQDKVKGKPFKYAFNDVELSSLLMRDDIEFYKQETVQRLIDYQWQMAYRVNLVWFLIYLLLYVYPLFQIVTSPENPSIHQRNLQIMAFPAIFFFLIEITQMRKQGFDYLKGWNIFDLTSSISFAMFYMSSIYKWPYDAHEYHPEIKLVMVLLMFIKLCFFCRIFENFGFLVQMIVVCLGDLVAFITCFVSLLLVFSMCLMVLNNEIDKEVDDAQALGYFQKTVLQAFRTSIGELGMPRYTKILAQPESFKRNLNIFLIWVIWYLQTFTMLVVMLNFIIAVITSTFDRVNSDQVFISYNYKADLNSECFELLASMGVSWEFKSIVFSTIKKNTSDNIDKNQLSVQEIKKFIYDQNTHIERGNEKIRLEMKMIEENMTEMDQENQKKFKKISQTQKEIQDRIIGEIQKLGKK